MIIEKKEVPEVEELVTEEPLVAGEEATPPDLGIHIGEDIDMSEAIG